MKHKKELVDPRLCEKCGFRGTPLCTHPDGYYQDEPAGLNKLLLEGRIYDRAQEEEENTEKKPPDRSHSHKGDVTESQGKAPSQGSSGFR